jgi:hypothetical protein
MGGRSDSLVRVGADGGLVFEGSISLDGGGFASCRTLIDSDEPVLGLPPPADTADVGVSTHCLRMELTADGQQYKIGLRASDGFREPTWQAQFNTVEGKRMTVVIPLNERDWHASLMGRRVPHYDPTDWQSMRGLSFSLSLKDAQGNDTDRRFFREGPFHLHVHSMELRRMVDSLSGLAFVHG